MRNLQWKKRQSFWNKKYSDKYSEEPKMKIFRIKDGSEDEDKDKTQTKTHNNKNVIKEKNSIVINGWSIGMKNVPSQLLGFLLNLIWFCSSYSKTGPATASSSTMIWYQSGSPSLNLVCISGANLLPAYCWQQRSYLAAACLRGQKGSGSYDRSPISKSQTFSSQGFWYTVKDAQEGRQIAKGVDEFKWD